MKRQRIGSQVHPIVRLSKILLPICLPAEILDTVYLMNEISQMVPEILILEPANGYNFSSPIPIIYRYIGIRISLTEEIHSYATSNVEPTTMDHPNSTITIHCESTCYISSDSF